MFKVNLSSCLELSSSPENPFFHKLKHNHYNNTAYISLEDLILKKPILDYSEVQKIENVQLSGNYYNYNTIFSFVNISDDFDKENFFLNYGYSHYSDLESDLIKINPNYKFKKSSKNNLNNYIYYFLEATKEMTNEEICKLLSKNDKIIKIEELKNKFIKYSGNFYGISHDELNNIDSLNSIKDKLKKESISYILADGNRNNCTLQINSDNYILTFIDNNKDNIKSFKFKINEYDLLINKIEDFFKPFMHKDSKEIILYAKDERESFNYTLETSALKIQNKNLNFYPDLSFLRSYFNAKTKTKGRSQEALLDKSLPILEQDSLELSNPLFNNMGSYLKSFDEEILNNNELKKINNSLSSEDPIEQFDTFLKLSILFSKNNKIFIDPFTKNKLEKSHYERTVSNSIDLFSMPDYISEVENAKDFDSIIS